MLDIEFQRESDVAALESKLKNDKIKIVAGLRRAGKSYLLDPLFKRHLIVNGGFNERNFEIKDFSKQDEIDTDGKLRAYLNGLAFRRNLKFIFLDEPQETGENFAEILLKFHKAHPEYQIFITGSNSKTLSDDIVEYFGDDGDPLFIEALPYRDIVFELPDFTLDDYFKVGGLPSVLVEETESERPYRLKMLYKGLYLTDVQDRLAKMGALKKLSYLEAERIIAGVCSNLTTPISVSGIVTAHLGKGRASGSVERNAFSKDCIAILYEAENSYLLYRFIYPRVLSDTRNPNDWETHQIKYYCYDIGLLRSIANSSDVRGCVLENAVFLELHRLKLAVKPYIEYDEKKQETKNIDFSFTYKGANVLLQVTYEINIGNEKREVENLLAIKGEYTKYIVYVRNQLGEAAGIIYLSAENFFKNFL